MKKIVIIAIILIEIQITANSQNWDLFPMNQISMFELSFNNQPPFVERIVKDSMIVYHDSIVSYFNSKWISSAKCSSVINNKDLSDEYSISYLQLDSCVEKNGRQYFNCPDFGEPVRFIFNGHAQVNDSWIISENITFKCDSVSQKNIFGHLDSVKYFSNTKVAISFILSKNFGLIEFAPFGQLIHAYVLDIAKVKLIGLENKESKIGTTIPEFKDFFHLHSGDVVFSNFHLDPWDPREPIIDYYYKDSITQSTITDDSVIYEITSTRGINKVISKQSYYKNKLADFLNPNTSLGFFSNDNPCGFHADNLMYWQCINISTDSSLFSLSFDWSSLLLDSTNCKLARLIDAGSNFSLNTKVGLAGCNGSTVMGAIINGEKWGMTKIPTGISETVESITRIYPNPCHDKLFVQLENFENVYYRIYNVQGQLVKTGQIETGCIDLSDLKNGNYNLQLFNDMMLISRKIIKLNSP